MEGLTARYRATVIIIAAQIVIISALAGAAWFDVFNFDATASVSTVTILWVAVIFIAVGSFVLRRTFFTWEKLTDTALLKGKKGLIKYLQTGAIILCAAATAIAAVGLAITILSGDKFQLLRAAAIALIVCLINFPRRRIWEKVVGNLEKFETQR